MEKVSTYPKLSVHPSSLLPESVSRLAPRMSDEGLKSERARCSLLLETRLSDLRRECMALANVTDPNAQETVTSMLYGLDMFVENYMKLLSMMGTVEVAVPTKE